MTPAGRPCKTFDELFPYSALCGLRLCRIVRCTPESQGPCFSARLNVGQTAGRSLRANVSYAGASARLLRRISGGRGYGKTVGLQWCVLAVQERQSQWSNCFSVKCDCSSCAKLAQ